MTTNDPVTNRRSLITALLITTMVVVADQFSKWWILERVMQPPRVIEITPFFNLVMVWNRGVSFGMFNNSSPYNSLILVFLTVGVASGLGVWLWREKRPLVQQALGSIIGGAIGNAIDRIHHNGVADFLDVHAFGLHWPAFNVADGAITIGAALLIWDALFLDSNSLKKSD